MVVSVKGGQQCVYPFVSVADNGDMCASSDKDDKSVSPYTCIANHPDMGQLYACICNIRNYCLQEQMAFDANRCGFPVLGGICLLMALGEIWGIRRL